VTATSPSLSWLTDRSRCHLLLVGSAAANRGRFPTEQAAMKILYVTGRERRPNRANPTGRIPGWKTILNTLALTYGERLTNH
jgi:hypothetical protein